MRKQKSPKGQEGVELEMSLSRLSILELAFKEHPEMKVINFLEKSKFDHTITQIAKSSGVSRTVVRKMRANRVLQPTRFDEKSYYYQLK